MLYLVNSELWQKIGWTYIFRGTTKICGNSDAETEIAFGGKGKVSNLNKESEQSEEKYRIVTEHLYWRTGFLNGRGPVCMKRQRNSGSLGAF